MGIGVATGLVLDEIDKEFPLSRELTWDDFSPAPDYDSSGVYVADLSTVGGLDFSDYSSPILRIIYDPVDEQWNIEGGVYLGHRKAKKGVMNRLNRLIGEGRTQTHLDDNIREALGPPEDMQLASYMMPNYWPGGNPLDVLVYARHDTRTINGKKVLFINEIQDNWAKKIAKKLGSQLRDRPFKRSGHELGISLMITEAARKGYDAIAWTSGLMQVDRNSTAFRSVADRIDWSPFNPMQPNRPPRALEDVRPGFNHIVAREIAARERSALAKGDAQQGLIGIEFAQVFLTRKGEQGAIQLLVNRDPPSDEYGMVIAAFKEN